MAKDVERGVAICGSGVGVSVCADKVDGVRAGLCHDLFSARQGVEDDDLNVLCLGRHVVDAALASELLQTFLAARFNGADRHRRQLNKVAAIENMFKTHKIPSTTKNSHDYDATIQQKTSEGKTVEELFLNWRSKIFRRPPICSVRFTI